MAKKKFLVVVAENRTPQGCKEWLDIWAEDAMNAQDIAIQRTKDQGVFENPIIDRCLEQNKVE